MKIKIFFWLQKPILRVSSGLSSETPWIRMKQAPVWVPKLPESEWSKLRFEFQSALFLLRGNRKKPANLRKNHETHKKIATLSPLSAQFPLTKPFSALFPTLFLGFFSCSFPFLPFPFRPNNTVLVGFPDEKKLLAPAPPFLRSKSLDS